MSQSRFGAHGDVNIVYDTSCRTMFVEMHGPFNSEFMRYYEKAAAAVRKTIKDAHWVSLVEVEGLALAPMDALGEAMKTLEAATKSGLVATAVIFKEQEAQTMQKKFWSQVYVPTKLRYAFFDDKSSALHWLAEQLPPVEQMSHQYIQKND